MDGHGCGMLLICIYSAMVCIWCVGGGTSDESTLGRSFSVEESIGPKKRVVHESPAIARVGMKKMVNPYAKHITGKESGSKDATSNGDALVFTSSAMKIVNKARCSIQNRGHGHSCVRCLLDGGRTGTAKADHFPSGRTCLRGSSACYRCFSQDHQSKDCLWSTHGIAKVTSGGDRFDVRHGLNICVSCFLPWFAHKGELGSLEDVQLKDEFESGGSQGSGGSLGTRRPNLMGKGCPLMFNGLMKQLPWCIYRRDCGLFAKLVNRCGEEWKTIFPLSLPSMIKDQHVWSFLRGVPVDGVSPYLRFYMSWIQELEKIEQEALARDGSEYRPRR